jgi:hypothetical protein
MAQYKYLMKLQEINERNDGFKVVIKGANPKWGIHLKTNGHGMRVNHVGFRSDGLLEISSHRHCAIERFEINAGDDGIPTIDPEVIEGNEYVDQKTD